MNRLRVVLGHRRDCLAGDPGRLITAAETADLPAEITECVWVRPRPGPGRNDYGQLPPLRPPPGPRRPATEDPSRVADRRTLHDRGCGLSCGSRLGLT